MQHAAKLSADYSQSQRETTDPGSYALRISSEHEDRISIMEGSCSLTNPNEVSADSSLMKFQSLWQAKVISGAECELPNNIPSSFDDMEPF